MTDENENWRALKLGDRIRIVRIPSLFDAAHYHNGEWDDTFDLYHRLIQNRSVLVISEFDDQNRPWVEYSEIEPDGTENGHSLAVDDDSWVLLDDSP